MIEQNALTHYRRAQSLMEKEDEAKTKRNLTALETAGILQMQKRVSGEYLNFIETQIYQARRQNNLTAVLQLIIKNTEHWQHLGFIKTTQAVLHRARTHLVDIQRDLKKFIGKVDNNIENLQRENSNDAELREQQERRKNYAAELQLITEQLPLIEEPLTALLLSGVAEEKEAKKSEVSVEEKAEPSRHAYYHEKIKAWISDMEQALEVKKEVTKEKEEKEKNEEKEKRQKS